MYTIGKGTYKGALEFDTMRDFILGAAQFYNPIKCVCVFGCIQYASMHGLSVPQAGKKGRIQGDEFTDSGIRDESRWKGMNSLIVASGMIPGGKG